MTRDLRLLYSEDEAYIREIARLALADEGFEIMSCESGHEALRKASHFKPDLILLDVMMPGMDGQTTLKKLRELSGLGTAPVIFLTAKRLPDDVSELAKPGSLDVIPNPFDPMQLANQIKMIWISWHD